MADWEQRRTRRTGSKGSSECAGQMPSGGRGRGVMLELGLWGRWVVVMGVHPMTAAGFVGSGLMRMGGGPRETVQD